MLVLLAVLHEATARQCRCDEGIYSLNPKGGNIVLATRRNSQFDPFEVEIAEKSRRRPGQFLREKFLMRGFHVVFIGGLAVGLLTANLLYWFVVGVLGLGREFSWFLIYFAVVGLIAIVGMTYSRRGWSTRNLLKGLDSETVVADVIERSMLGSFGCFLANDVMLRRGRGNVDHIVVTPASVLVVETKYRRVRRKDFRKVLEKIDMHVRILKQHVGAEADVVGCLVFAHPAEKAKKSYEFSGQTIRAFTLPTLKSFLAQECSNPRTLNRGVSQKIAELAFDAEDRT